jgi:hypothetical protein
MIKTHPITEQDLIDLDFKMVFVSKEEHGGDNDFYYYVLSLFGEEDDTYAMCLISCANDEAVNKDWRVELFDYDRFYFDTVESLTEFILAAKNAKKK